MAGYKVSYKVLRQQGEDMKAVAKMIDGYAEKVNQINSKLGSDDMLAELRQNLQKLRIQLGESRTVLNTAGELLVKTVDGYSGVEARQVKKVDSMKAHNRDFYKNPVVVASAGGAAGATAAGIAAPPVSTQTTNYIDNSQHITYVTTADVPVETSAPIAPDITPATAPSVNQHTAESPMPAATKAASPTILNLDSPTFTPNASENSEVASRAGFSTGAGILGAATGVGATLGASQLKKKHDEAQNAKPADQTANEDYDPEVELEKAIKRVRELESEE